MDFLENAVTTPDAERIYLQKSEGGRKITPALFGDQLEHAQRLYSDNELLSIHVPVIIHPTGRKPVESHFRVLLQKDDTLDAPDVFFIRAGITVSDVRAKPKQNVRAIFFAEDESISTFLGDAETPAHTDWNERTEIFKENYENPKSALQFVRSSIREIAKILDIPSPGIDPDFLKEIFYFEESETEKGKKPEKPEIPEPKPSIFSIKKADSGFSLKLSKKDISFPVQALVHVAYDTVRGNPFKKYLPIDFDFSKDEPSFEVRSGEIIQKCDNKIQVKVLNNEFELKVSDFDPHRDLIVAIKEVE